MVLSGCFGSWSVCVCVCVCVRMTDGPVEGKWGCKDRGAGGVLCLKGPSKMAWTAAPVCVCACVCLCVFVCVCVLCQGECMEWIVGALLQSTPCTLFCIIHTHTHIH